RLIEPAVHVPTVHAQQLGATGRGEMRRGDGRPLVAHEIPRLGGHAVVLYDDEAVVRRTVPGRLDATTVRASPASSVPRTSERARGAGARPWAGVWVGSAAAAVAGAAAVRSPAVMGFLCAAENTGWPSARAGSRRAVCISRRIAIVVRANGAA